MATTWSTSRSRSTPCTILSLPSAADFTVWAPAGKPTTGVHLKWVGKDGAILNGERCLTVPVEEEKDDYKARTTTDGGDEQMFGAE